MSSILLQALSQGGGGGSRVQESVSQSGSSGVQF